MSLGQNLLNTERLFRLALKLPIVRIPFPGAAPILSSTAAGHTLVAYIGLPPAAPFIKEAPLRPLGAPGPARPPTARALPTMPGAGRAGRERGWGIGMLAPAAPPRSLVASLRRRRA